ncbi:TetR/AcrR family transcriptional regulator [Motilimonas sp. 1_MG-2023]|uniref:TetR/AcrR family transcriptional regulator n=1 Tax=Motilimonas sp. 1_MG-2023 TaxID=3062672 RepID=UPI0026E2E11F|nr:TetR/AcrR family transcriptional regulator [Motilimonas sp. 1_MG-2023]MDO6526145.1 TetR/AcrR family transcriptional regulator [Motilimonas sp. 1_MG-2023]
MKKGTVTRMAILRTALDLASQQGLNCLTIGNLAKARGMSKSGVYAHFQSKQKLQLDLLQYAQLVFNERVIKPTRHLEHPIERLISICEHWYQWNHRFSGGCFFIGAVVGFDDIGGAIENELKIQQQTWGDHLKQCAQQAINLGLFKPDLDLDYFVYQINSLYLGVCWFDWLAPETAKAHYQRALAELLQSYKQ